MTNFDDVRKEDCILNKIPDGINLPGNRTVILQSVLNAIKTHGRSGMDREVCGVLVGNLCWDNGAYLLIDSMIEVSAPEHQDGSVAFTQETWNCVQYELTKKCPDKKIVGWYHTHPGFGVFLSNMDFFIHGTFFSARWQPLYVFDPKAETDGFFFWNNDHMEKGTAAIVADESPADQAPVYQQSAGIGVPYSAEDDYEELPAHKKFLTAAIIIAALLVICGLIGFTYFLQKQINELQKENNKIKLELSVASSASAEKNTVVRTVTKVLYRQQEKQSDEQVEQLKALKKQVADLEKKLNDDAAMLGDLKKSNQDKDTEIQKLQQQIAKKDGEIKDLSAKQANYAAMESRYQEQILYLQDNEKVLLKRNQQLYKDLASQKDRMDFLETRWAEYMSNRFTWYKPRTWF